MKILFSFFVCLILAIISLAISILSFHEKGFLFNNAYVWASKVEREKMDKKPHYRQTAIVFGLMALLFLCIAFEVLLRTGWLWSAVCVIGVIMIGYAIVSSVKQK